MHGVVPARVRVGYGDVAEIYGAFFGEEGAEGVGPGGVGVDFCGVDVCDAGARDVGGGKGVRATRGFGRGGDERGEEGEEEMCEEGWHFVCRFLNLSGTATGFGEV